MPVVARLDWIARQIQMGRRAHFAVGEARDSGKWKIKVCLRPPEEGSTDIAASAGLLALVIHLRHQVVHWVAVDRGHRYSSGVSEISIWLSAKGGKDGNDILAAQTEVPAPSSSWPSCVLALPALLLPCSPSPCVEKQAMREPTSRM